MGSAVKSQLEKFVGKDVKILRPHVWAGNTGRGICIEDCPGAGDGLLVDLQNGSKTFVFRPDRLKEI